MSTILRNSYPEKIFILPTLGELERPIPLSAVESPLALRLRKVFPGDLVLVDYDGIAHIYTDSICRAKYDNEGNKLDDNVNPI